ncbi:hypothetical protein BSL78_15332, partial [Apostichopus japonicus]
SSSRSLHQENPPDLRQRLQDYDFCLAEDAARTVMVKKSKKHFDLNNLPPEALQRNEYSWASDMWSIAVVIWEVLSAEFEYIQDGDQTDICYEWNNGPLCSNERRTTTARKRLSRVSNMYREFSVSSLVEEGQPVPRLNHRTRLCQL